MSPEAQHPRCCKLSSLPLSPCAGFVPSGPLWPITVAAAASKSVCLHNNRKDSFSLWVSFFFFGHTAVCGILVPGPGIKPMPTAVEAQSLNHWTTREVPVGLFLLGVKLFPETP